jgi:hypothetical protein
MFVVSLEDLEPPGLKVIKVFVEFFSKSDFLLALT